MAHVRGTTPKNFLLASLAVIFVPPLLKLWRRPWLRGRYDETDKKYINTEKAMTNVSTRTRRKNISKTRSNISPWYDLESDSVTFKLKPHYNSRALFRQNPPNRSRGPTVLHIWPCNGLDLEIQRPSNRTSSAFHLLPQLCISAFIDQSLVNYPPLVVLANKLIPKHGHAHKRGSTHKLNIASTGTLDADTAR